MSKLNDSLMANDKKGIFSNESSKRLMGYSTGFLPFDYQNGYLVSVNDKSNKLNDQWANTGLFGGQFVTVIGRSGVAKTSFCVQAGSHIIRPFEYGEYYHIDAEGSSNLSRIRALNNFSIEEMREKYFMPGIDYVEDAFSMIYKLAKAKMEMTDLYYNTGRFNEYGEEIKLPQPTVVLIDSLPSLQTKEVEDSEELGTQTYNMRLAIAYNTFYKRLRPIITRANITVMAINHIKEKPELAFQKTQAQIQYMKTNENIPGGTGPIYYSQNLFRFIYRGKLTAEKDGIEGFIVDVEFIKSKTNRGGAKVTLVYDYETGFNSWLTLLYYLNNLGLVKGRNPYSFFESEPSIKFNSKQFMDAIKDEKLRTALLRESAPHLMELLSRNKIDVEKEFSPTELIERFNASYSDSVDVDVDTEAEVGLV